MKKRLVKRLASLASILAIFTITALVFTKVTAKADTLVGFDEGYGSTTHDSKGTATGTIYNAVWKPESECASNKCLYFDGSGDYVDFTDDANFDFAAATNFTIEFWFRTKDITSGTRVMVGKYRGDDAEGGYKVYMSSDGKVNFGVDDDNSWTPDGVATSTTAYDDNNWHHLVASKTGTTDITLYVDGIRVAKNPSVSGIGTLVNDDALMVGMDSDGSNNPYTGYIDELKIFTTTARSETQVKTDYQKTSSTTGTSARFGPDNSWLTQGLVGYWKMDETSGNAIDSSGNSNSLTNTGTATYAGTKFGNGVALNGTSQYLYIADNSTLSVTGDLTISAWARPTTLSNFNDIVAKWDGVNKSYMLTQLGNGSLRFALNGTGNYVQTGTGVVTASTLAHITAVYQAASATAKIYINGIESPTTVSGTIPTSINDDGSRFQIGVDTSTTTPANYYDGRIDDVRIYSRAFAPLEVQKLYSWAPGPVGYWKLDEVSNGTGAVTRYDSSTYGNNLTDNNTVTSVLGKYNNAAYFTRANSEYLSILDGSQTGLDITGDITVSFWLYDVFDAQVHHFVTKEESYNTDFGYWVGSYNGKIFMQISQDGTTTTEGQTDEGVVNYGEWTYITAVARMGQDIRIYINGQLSNTGNIPLTISQTSLHDSSYEFQIGGDGGENFNFNNGELDDVKIYNYARSPAQIVEDMNAGHPAPGSPIGSSIAHWKFDEGYSTTAHDSSPNANDLTLNSASWTNSGKFGKAWNGTGGDIRLSRSTDPDLEFLASESFTISTWFKSDATGNPAATEYLVANGGPAGSAGYAVYATTTNGYLCFGIDDDASWGPDVSSCTTTDYYDNTWHNVVAVRDVVADSLYLYIDGVNKDGDNDTTTATLASAASFYIGDIDTDNAGSGEEFAGDIDDTQIFRSALTSDQAKQLYNQGFVSVMGSLSTNSAGTPDYSAGGAYCLPGDSTSCTAPVLELHMDENSGTTINDTSPNTNTGTLTSGASFGPGKYGSGVQLDGKNDFVSLADSTQLDLQNSYTIETWIKPNSGLDSNTNDFTTIFDKGVYQLFYDHTATKFKFTADTPTTNVFNYAGISPAAATYPEAFYLYNDYLYMGGTFTDLGDTHGDYLVKYDGTSWTSIGGTDLSGGGVYSIVYYKGKLYIAGVFTNAGGNATADYVARWSGSDWESFTPTALNAPVGALQVFNNELYISGAFTNGEGLGANYVMKYDGTNFSTVASGMAATPTDMAVYNNELYICGQFQNVGSGSGDYIVVLRNDTWTALGSGLSNTCDSLAVYQDKLYIGGTFADAGGNATADDLATWDGSNFAAVSGWANGQTGSLYSLVTYEGKLYVGGGGDNYASNANCDKICVFDGSSWSSLYTSGVSAIVESMGVYNGQLFVGGRFDNAGGVTTADRLAKWSGTDEQSINSSAVTVAANTWAHIAIASESGSLKYYVNGIPQGTGTMTVAMNQNSLAFYLGKAYGGRFGHNGGHSSYEGVNGALDNFVVYNYARTPAQIAWDYNHGGPVAWYKFDETSWNNNCAANAAYDSSGNVLHGASCPNGSGPTAPTTGKFNNAVTFDGSDDHVSITDPGTSSALDFTTGQQITLAAWVKPTNLPSNNTYMTILTKGATNGTDNANYVLGYGQRSSVYVVSFCYVQTATSTWHCHYNNINNFATGSWYHFAVTYTFGTAASVYAYQNGVSLPQGTWGSGDGIQAPTVSNEALWIGGANYAGGGSVEEDVDGLLDDVRIYNYALNATQVKTLYSGSAAVKF